MIKELSELGEKENSKRAKNQQVHIALKKEIISIDLIIREDGTFDRFRPIPKQQTIAEAITAKKGRARLLLDKAEEVLCYGGKKSEIKHRLFLKKLKEYSELTELAPVINFYEKNKKSGLDQARARFEKDFPKERDRQGNIAFRLVKSDKRIHEEEKVYIKIKEIFDKKEALKLAEKKERCSICGDNSYSIPEIHEKIKAVPPVDDGRYSARSIISFNDEAYESYELKRNKNAGICAKCAKNYVEGLNWLLGNGPRLINDKGKEYTAYTNRKTFGLDTVIVFWTKYQNEVSDIRLLEEPDAREVASLIDSVQSGADKIHRHIEEDQFYSCALSGTAARIAVRDWLEISLGDFKQSIAKWFQDIAIDEFDRDQKKKIRHYARLYDLARSCQRANSNGTHDKKDPALARAATSLWNAAIKETLPPIWLLTKVLRRARLDKWGITADKVALIKLILNRHNKGGGFVIKESLHEGPRPIAYVCGQLFAKMESIQHAALGDKNAGIRERYFTYAMTTPASAFGRLFSLSSKHFTKLKSEKPGLAVNMDKEMQELCKDVDINRFPVIFSLVEQGQFAIGYYHQKQAQFSKSNKKDQEEK